jgi:hypothetical protein
MSSLHIEGQAKAVFVFDFVPSWNEVIDKARTHWAVGHTMTKRWRAEGYTLAVEFMRAFFPQAQYLIDECALIVVKVYRPDENLYDVHNVCIKAIGDGFTEGRIWRDDEWASVPLCLFAWADYDGQGVRTEIEIHELEAYTIDGVGQVLPRGRVFEMKGKKKVGQVPRRLPGEQLLFDNSDEAFWWTVWSNPNPGPEPGTLRKLEVRGDGIAPHDAEAIREHLAGRQLELWELAWAAACEGYAEDQFGPEEDQIDAFVESIFGPGE